MAAGQAGGDQGPGVLGRHTPEELRGARTVASHQGAAAAEAQAAHWFDWQLTRLEAGGLPGTLQGGAQGLTAGGSAAAGIAAAHLRGIGHGKPTGSAYRLASQEMAGRPFTRPW
jgi:hypothetical protein